MIHRLMKTHTYDIIPLVTEFIVTDKLIMSHKLEQTSIICYLLQVHRPYCTKGTPEVLRIFPEKHLLNKKSNKLLIPFDVGSFDVDTFVLAIQPLPKSVFEVRESKGLKDACHSTLHHLHVLESSFLELFLQPQEHPEVARR